MHRLIDEVFVGAFANPWLAAGHDGAVLPTRAGNMAFTSDAFVVKPIFFPGGDIGSLAVYGTVNDLAMCGARPRALSARTHPSDLHSTTASTAIGTTPMS